MLGGGGAVLVRTGGLGLIGGRVVDLDVAGEVTCHCKSFGKGVGGLVYVISVR